MLGRGWQVLIASLKVRESITVGSLGFHPLYALEVAGCFLALSSVVLTNCLYSHTRDLCPFLCFCPLQSHGAMWSQWCGQQWQHHGHRTRNPKVSAALPARRRL